MTRFLSSGRKVLTAAAAALTAAMAYGTPAAPANLKADVNGLIVDLTWEWGNLGQQLLRQDFEQEEFPPAGWDLERGYTLGESGNWMLYSFAEDDEETLTHSGLNCAMVMMAEDYDEEDPSTLHQDEWLIVKPGAGAEYMDFWYFIHPELLEVGGYKDFPDHYYVKISRDGGDSWTELWDARWDMGNSDAPQQASLFLGDPADEETLVAFEAVSGEEESLYFLWVVDDVEFYAGGDATALRPTISATTRRHAAPAPGMRTHREFRHDPSMRRVARIPESEWLNAGQTTFRVYRDDEVIADYIKTRHYTDYGSKEKGTHTYRVMAWNEADDKEFEAASADVEISEFEFLPARNVKGYWAEQIDSPGKYQIEVGWDAPESEMQPSYYNIYVNDKSIGRVEVFDVPYSLGQHGLYKGVYKFSVEAVYEYPEGTAEKGEAYVFPGTVPTPVNLTATPDAGGYRLEWQLPAIEESDAKPVDYTLYRGDEEIGRTGGAMTYTDATPLSGHFTYAVHAEYADGSVSLPATVKVENGDALVAALPLKEEFSHGHLPAHWSAELMDPYSRVKDMYAWRFDNWFGIEVPEEAGITGGFASISCPAAGFNLLESYLVSPRFEVPATGKTSVEFDRWFDEPEVGPSGAALCELQINADGDEEWTALANLNSADRGHLSVALDTYAGKRVAVRWAIVGRASGLLVVDNVAISNDGNDAVETVSDPANTIVDIFTPAGMMVRKGVSAADAASLPSGIYLLRSRSGEVTKVAVK